MATSLDLSLPHRVPEMEDYHDQPERILPFALYTLCELEDQTFESYRQLCATECGGDILQLPPRPRFVDESLSAIVEYHVQLGKEGNFDPTYFLVYVRQDSKSVLVVTLDDDDLECKPGKAWVKMNASGLLLVNLQIGNTDWAEAVEEDVESHTWPDDDDDDDDDDDEEKEDTDDPSTPNDTQNDTTNEASDQEDKHKDESPPVDEDYGQAPPLGFHIQVYTIPGVDNDALLSKMEPMSYVKKADQSDWVCKLHKLPKDAIRDPTRFAADLHPYQCSKHPTLEKKFFIAADETTFVEEGVAIVNIDWDGKTNGSSKEELLDFGRSFMIGIQRAEVPDTATRAAVSTACMLAQGYLKWQPKVKQFAIYYINGSDADIKLASAIDSRWEKRGHGEQRVALGGSMKAEEIEEAGGFWPALIRRHVAYCRRQTFVPAFVRQYFVYCDVEEPTGTSETQLVKLDWNGDLRSMDSLAQAFETKATVVKISASKAHKALTDVSNSEMEWQGEALRA